MRIISLAALSATLVLSAPTAAQNNVLSSDEQAGKAISTEKKVCRKLTITGSRMGERVCLTPSEWKKVDELK